MSHYLSICESNENNKYIQNYDQNKESLCLKYWDGNNLHRWAMSQKLPINDFKRVKETFQFNEDFIKIYNEDSDIEYFIEANVQYLEKFHKLHNDLPFLPERMKIEKKKSKLVSNLHDKEEHVIHTIMG